MAARFHKTWRILLAMAVLSVLCLLQKTYPSAYTDDSLDKKAVLSDSYYTIQHNSPVVSSFLEKADVKKQCVQNTVNIPYVVCSPRRDFLIGRIEKTWPGWNTEFAQKLHRILLQNPMAAFIDIGANIGTISLPLMKKLGPTRSYLMVEPNSDTYLNLILGIHQNGFQNFDWNIIPRAMWNSSDDTLTWVSSTNSTNGYMKILRRDPGMSLPKESPTDIEQAIKTGTIDNHVLPVAMAMGITQAIMKVDIEASECVAFQKADKFLATLSISHIFMEYAPATKVQANWDCIEKLIRVLTRHNYLPFDSMLSDFDKQLDIGAYRKWNANIVWRKVTSSL